MTKEETINIAVAFDFELTREDELTHFLRFQNGTTRVDIWESGVVGIYKKHLEAMFVHHIYSENDLIHTFKNI